MRIDLPVSSIECLEVVISNIAPLAPLEVGDSITWKWIVRDVATGVEYPLLES